MAAALAQCVIALILALALYGLARRLVIWAYARYMDSFLGYRGDRAR